MPYTPKRLNNNLTPNTPLVKPLSIYVGTKILTEDIIKLFVRITSRDLRPLLYKTH